MRYRPSNLNRNDRSIQASRALRAWAGLVVALGWAFSALGQSAPALAPEPERRWDSFLPLGGESVRASGRELPLPFGFGASVMSQWQNYEFKEIRLGIGGAPVAKMDGLRVSPAAGHDSSFLGRFDAWLFPFLNIYGIGGYTSGKTATTVQVPPLGLPLAFKLDYEGPTYGGGATLVWGHKHFFTSVDYNYTRTALDISDSSITAHVLTPRAGFRGNLGPFRGAAWVGAMYQGVAQRFRGRLTFNSMPVRFDVDEEPTDPWNFLMGFRWQLSPHFNLMVEGGVGGRQQVYGGLTYRF
jgi:hypothetical protein